ncbi:hypothetical protein F442_15207 [Phytophthora nicotianae P10297]|uniref:Uncharacterized protein n=1 Tax=Phytophthora nicotianae P10297 TaxID=1317064 RepID=W2YPF6_PHYNI|nr:hypothetical protein F442_15207 [Phytophthora nicotianae P10297]
MLHLSLKRSKVVFKAKYDIDIRAVTRFTISDTTPSARNVVDHIDSELEDCSMHLLNLCIGYVLGVKNNSQTNGVWNAACHSWDKVVAIVTPGGYLEEESVDVIQKLRNPNKHFRSPKQRNALKKIQKPLSYPELDPMVDKVVRVAYTCKQDWILATEMEAVTHLIAIVALIEAQSENLVLSYMVVSRCLAQKKLKAFKFDAMVIEAPRAKDENEESHRRVVGTLDHVLDAGKTCLKRTLLHYKHGSPKSRRKLWRAYYSTLPPSQAPRNCCCWQCPPQRGEGYL